MEKTPGEFIYEITKAKQIFSGIPASTPFDHFKKIRTFVNSIEAPWAEVRSMQAKQGSPDIGFNDSLIAFALDEIQSYYASDKNPYIVGIYEVMAQLKISSTALSPAIRARFDEFSLTLSTSGYY